MSRNSLISALTLSVLLGCAPVATLPDAGPTRDAGLPSPTPEVCDAVPAGAAAFRLGAEDGTRVTPSRRVVLMGGSVEVDAHSRLFVEGAGGGDVLVVRASGAVDSYTPYFHSELGAEPPPSSTETVRLDDPAVGSDDAVICRVTAAEAVWLAGGDQFDYLGRWPGALHAALNAVAARDGAIGGTSAGAMALGEHAFDAALGSITSATALADPLRPEVSITSSAFAQPELRGFVVDTHFSQREREGRLLAFMARAAVAADTAAVFGIGIDERASLTIESGRYRVATGAAGRVVFVYALSAVPTLVAREALTLEGVRRLALVDGAEGEWPPSFEGAERFDVTSGELAP